MTRIKSVEEAVQMIEVCAIKEGEATENGDYKTNNKYARHEANCIEYLYKHGQLQALCSYLKHDNHSVRLSAAYALLPLYEEDCKKVLYELAKGDYGVCGLDAEMILKQWNAGELKFPYQADWSNIHSRNRPYCVKTNGDVSQTPPLIFLSFLCLFEVFS